jgi:hypothetical protein
VVLHPAAPEWKIASGDTPGLAGIAGARPNFISAALYRTFALKKRGGRDKER